MAVRFDSIPILQGTKHRNVVYVSAVLMISSTLCFIIPFFPLQVLEGGMAGFQLAQDINDNIRGDWILYFGFSFFKTVLINILIGFLAR